jgi:hypothetical protein
MEDKKRQNNIELLINRLKKLNIELEFFANYPWIYLDKVNGKKVKERYMGNHGFTAFWLTNNKQNPYQITDTKIVFKKIREMINEKS